MYYRDLFKNLEFVSILKFINRKIQRFNINWQTRICLHLKVTCTKEDKQFIGKQREWKKRAHSAHEAMSLVPTELAFFAPTLARWTMSFLSPSCIPFSPATA